MCLSYSSPPKVRTPTRYEENAELSESEEAIASILEQRYFNFNMLGGYQRKLGKSAVRRCQGN